MTEAHREVGVPINTNFKGTTNLTRKPDEQSASEQLGSVPTKHALFDHGANEPIFR